MERDTRERYHGGMAQLYDPASVEPKWQKKWEEAKTFDFDLKKAKDPLYLLVMFPYPSGARIHVGHWFQYSIPDSYGRYLRMRGKDVFHPMGFDAFGLPAENYAIKTGVPPAASTAENVQNMIVQFKRMGVMFDWKHTLNTSEPAYYRWTQWLFLQMYKHKLAYRKEAPVNFCPSCQTVLANEQAQDGTCERCGTPVIQKNLTQWFWKITDYAQRLLDGLALLDWPEKTKVMQRNWIGRKEGINITYRVKDSREKVTVFTTRPETNFGATFIVISPEHPQLTALVTADQKKKVAAYVRQTKKRTTSERTIADRKKTGVFTGSSAINDLTGVAMPIWVADYVLMDFGTGVVVGVPGHDLRDFEFAREMGIEVIRVIKSADGDTGPIDSADKVFEDEGEIINSDFLNGLHPHAAIPKMMDYMESKGMGKRVTTYRLHDWLVSRQRYWGAPIPVVYDPEGRPHPVPEKHLPWLLPTDVEFKPTGESPLVHSKEFIERTEKIFGAGWRPEFDTMDTFVCSSFYYLRFLMEGDQKKFVESKLEEKWLPVDMYIGGPEHACMHLIYARFIMMALMDMGFVSHAEPFQRLVHQGLITNKGAKMSKSKNNVVSPDEFVERHGSDVFRMYLMFMGPFTDGGDWSDTGIKGIDRFVQKVWRIINVIKKVDQDSPQLLANLHRTIARVTESLDRLHFNTAISSLMEFFNVLEKEEGMTVESTRTVVRLLTPLAPHLAEELWEMLGGPAFAKASGGKRGFAFEQEWPSYDPALLVSDTMTIVVQVNGKMRGSVDMPCDASEADIIAAAKTQENVKKYLEGRSVRKEIYVQGRLVNLVL
ncbi:MAG: leucyl-tRNA synthetase [Candidatus Peregrinibacteria bacterium Greene0416_19]|nr:MAG: leucyl-tRNA synthetase [Candidatus Peregrinibacteria bacterium Greene0416_19]